MSRRHLRALPLLFALCAATAAAHGQAREPCDRKPITDPAYFADVKPMPPGKFGYAESYDAGQLKDPSTPAALVGLSSASSPKPFSNKPRCAEVENRTTRALKSVQLRWTVTALAEDWSAPENAEPLAKGLLPVFEVEVAPGARRWFELRGVHYADFFQPLAARGDVNGKFRVTIGVARVEFADGTALDLP